jgi:hypothetical protein
MTDKINNVVRGRDEKQIGAIYEERMQINTSYS